MKKRIKSYLKNNPQKTNCLIRVYNYTIGLNKISMNKNILEIGVVILKNTKLIANGSNNKIIIKDLARLTNCKITINGNNNLILINGEVQLNNTELAIEDDNNQIVIGKNTTIYGKTHIAAIEGTSITIGNDCMFSSNIYFSTGDSHSILDSRGERINLSKNISIGNHVWIGTNVTCLKGAHISNNSIVGACSLVNKEIKQENVIVAGNPAHVVKCEINWSRERVKIASVSD
jgi:acetyltransferase-like isoleucine patch superfamily enzyme